jgi:hypothetical protein
MKTMLYTSALLLLAVWTVGFIVYDVSEVIHLLLAVDFLIILKVLKPEKEERITRITSERNYIK